MQWHRLPPRNPDECRFRTRVEVDQASEFATCELVRLALPIANERLCRVSREACAACCTIDPATPTAWNTVVASAVYSAATAVASGPDMPAEAFALATEVRRQAEFRLETAGMESDVDGEPVQQFGSLDQLIPPPWKRRKGRIANWAVGVTTAPRRAPTLERCLDHLARAGWDAPHIFMDSIVRVPDRFGHLPGTLRSPAIGAWPNHYLSLFELTLRQPDADAFLILQDDALIYDGENVREYLERVLWPSATAIVSLYCPAPYNASRFGWRRFRKSWVWGAQAFLFSPEAARRYLLSRRVCQHRWRSAEKGLTQIDVLLGWWAWWRRVPIWYPTPSLVRHIGDISTLWVDNRTLGKRAANLFVGPKGWVSRTAGDSI